MNRSCLNGVCPLMENRVTVRLYSAIMIKSCKISQYKFKLLSSTSADWDSPSLKLICPRTARAIWTVLCPPSTMVLTYLFVIHKSWMFLACQNAVLAPIPTHLLFNETSGKNRHKMAASVSAALFNWEENRGAVFNCRDCW